MAYYLSLRDIKDWFDQYNCQLQREFDDFKEDNVSETIHCMDYYYPTNQVWLPEDVVIPMSCYVNLIKMVLRFIRDNRYCQELQNYNVPIRFRITIEEVVNFLKALPIEYRRLVLKEFFDLDVQYDLTIKDGVLEPNLDKLMEVAKRNGAELKKAVTQIGLFHAFAQKYGASTEGYSHLVKDILTVKYIGNDEEDKDLKKFFQIEERTTTDEALSSWVTDFYKCYQTTPYCFTNNEKQLIDSILLDEHFKTICKTMGIAINMDVHGSTKKPLSTLQIGESASQESNFTWHLPTNFFDNSYIADCDINEYFPDFLNLEKKCGFSLESIPNKKMAEIKVILNSAFESLINTIAKDGYIDNNDVTKSSFAHALTGRKVDIEPIIVTWKRVSNDNRKPKDWLNDMCYLVRELYPTYLYDKSGNRMKNKFKHITEVFEIDPSGDYKLSSSYAKNADRDFIKKVEDFLEVVRMVKDSVFPEKGSGMIR